MRYVLRALGSNEFVEIDQAAYVDVARARDALVAIIGVEQKFDLVFENYADYERVLLELSLHQALCRDLDWPGSQNDIAAVSRRLANLLSAARLYLDQIKHDLRAIFGPTSDLPQMVKAKTSEQYDARFGYRLMETLRNAMQHRSMPVHALSYPSESVGQGLQFRAIPSIDVVRLKDAELKPAVFAELESRGETVELTPLVREYIEGIGNVHETFRNLAAPQVASWDSVLASIQARGTEPSGGGTKRAVLAFHLDDAENVIETVQVFTEVTEYRRAFERRNSVLSNLARRYVSSVCNWNDVEVHTFPTDSRLGRVLAADHANTRAAPELMALAEPWAVDAFEDTANLFRLLIHRLSVWSVEEAEDLRLREIARSLGLTDQKLIERLASAPSPELAEAAQSWSRLSAFRVVKMLVLACQRYWTWAATDLARLRITAAIGYGRLEAETVALAKLFLEEPELADRWLRIRTPKDGRQFFSDTQSRVKTTLEDFRLGKVYDIASSGGQHVRMASLARSFASRGEELSLPDQDFDPEDALGFHLAVAYFHRIQNRILSALGTIIPDVACEEWSKAVHDYSEHVDGLWTKLKSSYPGRVSESSNDR